MKQNEKQKLLQELSGFELQGIGLYIDGHRQEPSDIVEAICVNEDSIYMADYVQTEEGKLVEIRYDRIYLE